MILCMECNEPITSDNAGTIAAVCVGCEEEHALTEEEVYEILHVL